MFDGLQVRSSGLMRKYPLIAFIYRMRAETPTKLKISDRARERVWRKRGRTGYMKVTHRSGARFAASLVDAFAFIGG